MRPTLKGYLGLIDERKAEQQQAEDNRVKRMRLDKARSESRRWWAEWRSEDNLETQSYIVFLSRYLSEVDIYESFRPFFQELQLKVVQWPERECISKTKENGSMSHFTFFTLHGRVNILQRLGLISLGGFTASFCIKTEKRK